VLAFNFGELSEGQRCLICLYAILHFVLAKGHTVILDEPDNFISLREIQPWLMAAEDAVEDSGGQVLIISHHPEIINQWATSGGVQFVRDGFGLARVEDFRHEPDYGLEPAELVARGWTMGKASQVVVLVEDKRRQRFVRPYLAGSGKPEILLGPQGRAWRSSAHQCHGETR